MSPITTHVLDTARGQPAAGVPLVLEREESGAFVELARGVTNDDGRVSGLLASGSLVPGRYRMTFDTHTYFAASGTDAFYPWVRVVFDISDLGAHYHVPLLLSPFGYSTYRGS